MSGGVGADRLVTRALCWRIERTDGVAIGLTTHDRDASVDGLIHRASPGMTPSAIERTDGLEAATMDVAGALTHDAISAADLIAGRWDGARVRLFTVDWDNRGDAPVPLGEGTIGAVETADHGFTAEIRGATHALDRPVVEETAPECRAELGDRRCRVAMGARRRFARVTGVEDDIVTVDAVEPVPNAYGAGRLRWFGGANSGTAQAITGSDGATVTLIRPPAYAARPGDLVALSEGCDKSFATCGARFGNTANFRGEPHLPGIDLLTRYPGS